MNPSSLSPESLRRLIKAEVRAKLVFKISPHIGNHDEWTKAIDASTEGIMAVLDKYDIKENEG